MPANNSSQTTMAAECIRALLRGERPNDIPSEAFGEWRDVIDVLVTAHTHGGTRKVQEAFKNQTRRHPELNDLVSGDSDMPERPSAPADYPCPDVLWRGRFAEVARRLGERSWDIWAGTFAALGAVAQRQLHWKYYGPLYGMPYVLVIKPTGSGKRRVTETCRHLLPPTYRVRDAVQSAQALGPILADIERDKKKGNVLSVQSQPAMLLLEEWTVLERNMAIANSTLMDTLNSLFHRAWPWNVSRSDRPHSGGGDIVIPHPTLSICATTTGSLLRQCLGEAQIRAGFLNRYLVLPGAQTGWHFYDPTAAGMDFEALEGLLSDLTAAPWQGGSVWDAYNTAARDRLVAYGKETFEPIMARETLDAESLKRLHVYAHMISLLYAWAEGRRCVGEAHVEAAMAVVEVALAFMQHLLALPDEAEPPAHKRYEIALEQRILAYIRCHPGCSRSDVLRAFTGNRHARSADVSTMLNQVIAGGLVREERVKGTGKKPRTRLYVEILEKAVS